MGYEEDLETCSDLGRDKLNREEIEQESAQTVTES